MEDWKKRLKHETVTGAKNIRKLNDFMGSGEFVKLPRTDKDLLYEQQRAMSTYLQILGKRCERHDIDLSADLGGGE